MLRIACNCGKILKVGDETAGKKVKCPECGEAVLIKKPSAKPQAVARGTSKGDDYDDDQDGADEAPAPKKKSNLGCILAVVGVFLALFMVLLVGGGIAAYILIFNTAPKPTSSEVADAPVVAKELFAIRLQRPRKAGDVREVSLKAEQGQTRSANAGPSDGGKAEMLCRVKTLAVDSSTGQETEWEVVVSKFTVASQGKQETPLQPGTVLTGKLTGAVKNIDWQVKGDTKSVAKFTGLFLSRACGKELIVIDNRRPYAGDDDAVFGTGEKQAVGDSWELDKAVVGSWLNSGQAGAVLDVNSTKGKLVGVSGTGAERTAEVEAVIDSSIDSKKGPAAPLETTGSIQIKFAYQFPLENSQGPTQLSSHFDAKLVLANPSQGKTENLELTESVSLEIKYLPNEPIEVAKPPAPKVLVMKLAKGSAKWVTGVNNSADIDVSADYNVASGDAKGTSQYTLFLVYTTTGGKTEYKVATIPGTQIAFQPQGTLQGTIKGVVSPVATPNQVTELVLKEAPVKDPTKTTNLDTLSPVIIAGMPPSATPPGPKLQIELSNAKVERSGKSYKFTVDYKIVGGKLDPLANYTLQAELSGSKIPNGIKDSVVTKPKTQIEPQGTLTATKDFTQDFGKNPLFALRITEDRTQGTTTTASIVSTKDANGIITDAPAPPAPVKLTATITATVQRAGAGYTMTIQYKLSGPPDPNATYQFLYELKGAAAKGGKGGVPGGGNTGWLMPQNMQQAMSGKQFQQDGTFSFPIIVTNQSQFEVVLWEFSAAEPKGRKLGDFKGK